MMKQKKFSEWRTNSSLKPGDKGTLKVFEEFGEKLVCVRYRYNAEQNRMIKTVEIVVDERPWRTDVSERVKKARSSVGGEKLKIS